MSKLQKFGSVCFQYKQEKGNLSPGACLVYYTEMEKVQKHRHTGVDYSVLVQVKMLKATTTDSNINDENVVNENVL